MLAGPLNEVVVMMNSGATAVELPDVGVLLSTDGRASVQRKLSSAHGVWLRMDSTIAEDTWQE